MQGNGVIWMNIFVTRTIPEPGLERLRDSGADVEVNPHDRVLSHEELLEQVAGRDGVLCQLTDTIDAAVLEAAEDAKIFATMAVGFDNVNVAAATARGILVTNTPGVLTDATADLAWALLLAAARRIPEADRYAREGKFRGWAPTLLLGVNVAEQTLGLVGVGRIGTAVGRRAKGFRMKVLYVDPAGRNETLEREVDARRVELAELLEQSDFVSLHVPLTEQTKHLIGAAELGRMKPTAVLINTSRGPVVAEVALVEALRERRIGAAGLDVYEHEPELTPGLADLPHVVLAPHIGSGTVATRAKMAIMAADNLLAALRGETPPDLLNPEARKRP